jgi:hypothetical protein
MKEQDQVNEEELEDVACFGTGMANMLTAGEHILLCKRKLSQGLARTIYIRCMYGVFGRKITESTVIYGVHIRFWPTLVIAHLPAAEALVNVPTFRTFCESM